MNLGTIQLTLTRVSATYAVYASKEGGYQLQVPRVQGPFNKRDIPQSIDISVWVDAPRPEVGAVSNV